MQRHSTDTAGAFEALCSFRVFHPFAWGAKVTQTDNLKMPQTDFHLEIALRTYRDVTYGRSLRVINGNK